MEQSPLTLDVLLQLLTLVAFAVGIVTWLHRKMSADRDESARARAAQHKEMKTLVEAQVATVHVKLESLGIKVNQVEIDLLKHQRYAAENFATKNEVERDRQELMGKLDKIDAKIDLIAPRSAAKPAPRRQS